MSNPNKAKGTRWETAVCRFLQEVELDARRKVQRGRADEGDIEIRDFPDLVIQAKDHGKLALAGWCDDVEAQAGSAGVSLGFVVAKRRQAGVERAYAVCSLETLRDVVELLVEGRRAVEALQALEEMRDD